LLSPELNRNRNANGFLLLERGKGCLSLEDLINHGMNLMRLDRVIHLFKILGTAHLHATNGRLLVQQ
jgi:hypothetical protein